MGCVYVAMYTTLREINSKAFWVVALLLDGLSHGAILTAQNFATQAMYKLGDKGHAAAMYIFFRPLGIAIGVHVGATTI